jgi:pantetheine-phosphate adenylyltransferase
MADKRIGIYPGTFDPVTNGHVDIIRRAARLVDKLIVAVSVNAGKGPAFTVEERAELLKGDIADAKNGLSSSIEVVTFDGLLMHFAEKMKAKVIVRGLRAVSDFDYERHERPAQSGHRNRVPDGLGAQPVHFLALREGDPSARRRRQPVRLSARDRGAEAEVGPLEGLVRGRGFLPTLC